MPSLDSFNIEKFKAKFGDGAKGSLFYFQPQWPAGVQTSLSPEDVVYLVKAATIPDTTLEEATISWQGFDYKYATKHTYADLTVTFYVDLQAKVRMLFENWSNLVHNPLTNVWSTTSEYMVDQKLQMVGYQGQTIMEFTMHHAYPKDIGTIAMDYSTNEYLTFDVTFSYLYHTLSFNETGGAVNV